MITHLFYGCYQISKRLEELQQEYEKKIGKISLSGKLLQSNEAGVKPERIR